MMFVYRYFDPSYEAQKNAKKDERKLLRELERNGRRPVVLNDYERIIAGDVVYPRDVAVGFDSIGGLEEVKQEIYDLIALPLLAPSLFSRKDASGNESRRSLVTPPKGVLLYGPPGTGKTMLAKAIAKESGATFINLQMSSTMNKWFGESQKLVKAAFTLAHKLSPTIIFIDEIDSFLRTRGSDDQAAQSNMKAEFMALWDGMNDLRPDNATNFGVVIVGATNRPYDVDPAILRRMPRTFELDLPSLTQRVSILDLILKHEAVDSDVDVLEIARRAEGYSGSDLKELCRCAALRPIKDASRDVRFFPGEAPTEISLRSMSREDFLKALTQVKSTGAAAYAYERKGDGRGSGFGREGARPSDDYARGATDVLTSLFGNRGKDMWNAFQTRQNDGDLDVE